MGVQGFEGRPAGGGIKAGVIGRGVLPESFHGPGRGAGEHVAVAGLGRSALASEPLAVKGRELIEPDPPVSDRAPQPGAVFLDDVGPVAVGPDYKRIAEFGLAGDANDIRFVQNIEAVFQIDDGGQALAPLREPTRTGSTVPVG